MKLSRLVSFAMIFATLFLTPNRGFCEANKPLELKLLAKGNTINIGKNSVFAKPLKATQIPTIRVQDASGKSYSLAKLVGENGAIHLWSLHCAPCIAEMPTISKFVPKYNAKFGNFVFISSDKPSDYTKSDKKLRQLTGGKYSTYFLDMESQKKLFDEVFIPQTIFYNSRKIEQTRGIYLGDSVKDFDAIAKFLKANDK